MKHQSFGRHCLIALLRIYLILFAASIILPLLWTVWTSFKTNQEFFANPWSLPSSINLDNYIRGWKAASIGKYFFNSLYISVIVVAAVAVLGAMTSYVCTRFSLRLGGVVVTFYMLGMFIPTVLCVVSIFLQMRSLNLLNSHFGLILLYTAVQLFRHRDEDPDVEDNALVKASRRILLIAACRSSAVAVRRVVASRT